MGRISSHRNPEAGVLKEQVVVLRPPRDPRPGRSRHGSRVVTFLVGQSVQGLRLSGRDSTVTNAASVGWRECGGGRGPCPHQDGYCEQNMLCSLRVSFDVGC